MSAQLIQDYLAGLKRCLETIAVEKVVRIAEVVYEAYQQDRRIFIMGNGGSAACASHFACDINKGISYGLKKRFKVVCLNDNIPTMLAYANDIAYADIFVEQMKNLFNQDDVVIGISVSGNSANVLKAIDFANENGGKTIGLTGFDGDKLGKKACLSLIIPVDDMQQVEDAHLIVAHILMRVLKNKLKA